MRRAVSFLTPLGGARAPSPGSLDWFPVVGAAIGLVVGAAWWLASRAWPPAAAAAVAVAADVALTGYLHLDGLADSADGLLPPMDRARRLMVMTDPAIGAFGAVTLIVVLALRYGAFASTSAAPLVVGALWCGSRSAMAVTVRRGRYADPGGMASAFIGPVPSGEPDGTGRRGAGERHAHGAAVPAGVGLVVSVVLVVVGSGAHGVAVLGAEALGFGAVVALAYRRLGGYTGDVLGAAGVVGETVGLLLLAAKW